MFVCFVVGAFYLICTDVGFILLQCVTGKYKVTALVKVLGLNLFTHVTQQLLYLAQKCLCTFYENMFLWGFIPKLNSAECVLQLRHLLLT